MVANFVVLGFKNVLLSRKLVLFELLLQVAGLVQIIIQVAGDKVFYPRLSDLFFIFLIRNIRFSRIMREAQDVDFTFMTCI